MWFGVVSLFPEMVSSLADYGVVGRGFRENLIRMETFNPRDFAKDKHRTVDDRPYGGGPGMLMKVQPLQDAIEAARVAAHGACRVIYMSPQGAPLDHAKVRELADYDSLICVAGRYEGVDERLIEAHVDEEVSIGDYVLSGGELAAMVLMDAVARWVPGVLGHDSSAQQDSFSEGLLDCPHYTRPECYEAQAVPEVLLSGDHAAIRRWRLQQSLGRTWLRRPELLEGRELSKEHRELLDEFIKGVK